MKLKTLKHFTGLPHFVLNHKIELVCAKCLKEEAINILKAFKEFEDTDKHNWSFNGQIEKLKQLGIKEFFDFEEGDNGRLKDFIKHFFNISSEDLIEKVEGIDTSEGKITKVKGHKEGNVIVIDKITQEDLK